MERETMRVNHEPLANRILSSLCAPPLFALDWHPSRNAAQYRTPGSSRPRTLATSWLSTVQVTWLL